MKDEEGPERLQILVSDRAGAPPGRGPADRHPARHEVVGQTALGEVAAATASVRPDAAIVIVGKEPSARST